MEAQFCAECGATLGKDGQCSNSACPQSHAHKQGHLFRHGEYKQFFFQSIKFTERAKKIVPDCVDPDLDEIPIKQYDIARLQSLIKGAFAEGRLQVTNKRVLFRAVGTSLLGPTSLQYEFSIEELAGIEIRKEAHFNFFTTLLLLFLSALIMSIVQPIFISSYNNEIVGSVFASVVAVASVFLFFIFRKRPFLRHVVLSILLAALPLNASELIQTALGAGNKLQMIASLVGILTFVISLLYLAFAPNLVVNIKTKGGTSSVEIRRKDSLFSFQHNEYTGFSQVLPGPDTDVAIKEIGALIREVQQTGSYTEK